MSETCPYLPEVDLTMNWRSLNKTKGHSGIQFYRAALTYAQVLWSRDLQARAVLALDRALLTNLSGSEPELKDWPLPYRAMAWMLKNYDASNFAGNPRVHFQHLASRIRGDREDQRKWRAWACWYMACQIRPNLPGDLKQQITTPKFQAIRDGLSEHGIPGEANLWELIVQEKDRV